MSEEKEETAAEEESAEEPVPEGEVESADEAGFTEKSEPGTEGESAGEAEFTEEVVSAVDEEHPDRPEADQNFEDVFKRKTEQAPEFFTARVTVCTSPTFFRWVFGFGGKIRITGPEDVSEQYRGMLLRALGETGIGESPGCGDERF